MMLTQTIKIIKNMNLLLSVLIFLSLVGCSHSHQQQLQAHLAQIMSRPARNIVEPIPKVPPVPKEVYTSQNLPDPFLRPSLGKGEQPDLKRRKEALEAFPIDSLKMVGTIQENNKIWALISASDGTIYPITVGNYLGQNYGKVIKITSSEVVILESIKIGGEWQKRKTKLTLTE